MSTWFDRERTRPCSGRRRMTAPVRVGVVGTGSLGRHHVRAFLALGETPDVR